MLKDANQGQPLEYLFLHNIERVQDSHTWKKHVYTDLQLYICTFGNCIPAAETDEGRHTRFSQELRKHCRSCICSGHCTKVSASGGAKKVLQPSQTLRHRASMCINLFDQAVKTQCPLCNMVKPGTSQLRKHLGGYHEELALFVLPLANADSEMEGSSITSLDDTNGNLDSTLSDEHNETRQNDVADISSP